MESDPNKELFPFNAETLGDLLGCVDKLHGEILFGVDVYGATPRAEQYFLLTIAALDQARRYLALARIEQRTPRRPGP